jgi:hypothetical protein
VEDFLLFLCGLDFLLEVFDFLVELFDFFEGLFVGFLKFEVVFVPVEELIVGVLGLVFEFPENEFLFFELFLPVFDLRLDVLLGLDKVVDLILVMGLHILVLLLLGIELGPAVVKFLGEHLVLGGEGVKFP